MVETHLIMKMIRNPNTKPSDVLPNGLTASETAFLYLIESRVRRTLYKTRHKRKQKVQQKKPKGGKGKRK